MRVEVLYFDGCPTHLEAENVLRGALTFVSGAVVAVAMREKRRE